MLTDQQRKELQHAVDALCAQNDPCLGVGYARTVGILKAHLEMVADGFESPMRAIEQIVQRGKELTS